MKVRYESEMAVGRRHRSWSTNGICHSEVGPGYANNYGYITWDLGDVQIWEIEDVVYWKRLANETKV